MLRLHAWLTMTAWQTYVKQNSLRTAIPKTGLSADEVPKPGRHYANGGAEEFASMSQDTIADLVNRALRKAGRS